MIETGGARSDPQLAARLIRASLEDTIHTPFWTDQPGAPQTCTPLLRGNDCDLVVIGGGFTGLWTAILAKEREPNRDVVLIEAKSIAFGGSGRNGGFISGSLTHGLAHGEAMWPNEMKSLVRLGIENLKAIVDFTQTEGIDADLRMIGKTMVALNDHSVRSLEGMHNLHAKWGENSELLDRERMQADVNSPTYLGGLRVTTGSGLMDPARLSWGLKRAAESRGVRIYENTPVTSISQHRKNGVAVQTPIASVRSQQAVIATNGFTPLLKRLRYRILPIFDHVLVSEPLTASQLSDISWSQNQGMTDIGNQFHYYRRTPDDRILWGGYDAIYYRGNRTNSELEKRDISHQLLATQFFTTFPQLEGLRFSHKWAGIIDSTSRFTPAIGTAMHGNVAYAVGYTGLGTASSRFGANTMLDLLARRRTELTELTMVRSKPLPFPPEPFRYPLVQFTRLQLVREDRTGKRGAWLSLLDRFGVGFNS